MEDQEKVAQPVAPEPTPPKPPPPVVHKTSNAPLVGAIVFLALVIGATAFYFATQDKETVTALAPTPTTTQELPISPTATPASTDEIKEGKTTFTHEKSKDLAFSGYTLVIPAGWTQKEEKTDLTHLLTLSKDDNIITIMQGPMGGNQCIFEGDMPDGPANDYRQSKYVDIKAGQVTLRRIEPEDNQTTYSFCSNSVNSQDTFGIPTPYGVITYKLAVKSASMLKEMDEILATIK